MIQVGGLAAIVLVLFTFSRVLLSVKQNAATVVACFAAAGTFAFAAFVASRYFFFQAEDGIRDIGVTGVPTCALPILAAAGLAGAAAGLVLPARRAGAMDASAA